MSAYGDGMADHHQHHHEHAPAHDQPGPGAVGRADDPERFAAARQAAEWDDRYREQEEAIWSGRPNGRLVVEVDGLAPGRALDVGCGEGADAIWLAQRGWDVTAVDVSPLAVERARGAGERAGVVVDWVCGDALAEPFPPHSFDLVSLQYPALPKAAGESALRGLLDAVRPGGVLLAVYHDLDEEHRALMAARGFDPADYVLDGELRALLAGADDVSIELDEVAPRVDPPGGNPHIADVVLRARRR